MNAVRWMALTPSDKQPEAPPPTAASVANWSLCFSPDVYLIDNVVAIDARAVTMYWGGSQALWRHMRDVWAEQWGAAWPEPWRVGWGATAWQAWARAHLGLSVKVHTTDELPLAALPQTQRYQSVWHALGLRTWGDLRRLPRGSVARRWGAGVLRILDQAYGDQPVELSPWQAPAEFAIQRQWQQPATRWAEVDAVMPAMLQEMVAWMMARQLKGQVIEWRLVFDAPQIQRAQGRQLEQCFEICSTDPTSDFDIWWRLTTLHRAHWPWVEPVVEVGLKVKASVALESGHKGLWDGPPGRSLSVCLQEMSARWGGVGVSCVQTVADPIPERMQKWSDPAAAPLAQAPLLPHARMAPAWLLSSPMPLWMKDERPWYQGPLRMVLGPQRVGAWPWQSEVQVEPAQAVRRDYFVAWSERAGWLWVYREAEQWYLHGIYA